MTTLVIARAQQVIDTVLAVLRGDGFDAEGTTADDEALARLAAGNVTTRPWLSVVASSHPPARYFGRRAPHTM